jgi:hypothetical protein
MKKYGFFVAVGILIAAGLVIAAGIQFFTGSLKGNNEIPIVYTDATGSFTARLNSEETQIDYELTYSDLQADVTQAHIHIGKKTESGGISAWLCSNLATPPTPAGFVRPCPLRSGTVTGTIVAANVVGPASQGIAAGDFATLLQAIKDGNTYANVHSTVSPSGEIRGQIRKGKGHGDHGEDDGQLTK